MDRSARRSSIEVTNQIWDLAVIGGGPAGIAAAITAAKRGAQSILIDAPAPARPIEVVPAVAASLFQALGIETQTLPRVSAYVSRWHDARIRRRFALSNAYGGDFLLDRESLHRLSRQALAKAGVLPWNGRVTGISRTEDGGFALQCAHGTRVASSRILIATGRASLQALKGNARTYLDQQVAVYYSGAGLHVAHGEPGVFLMESSPRGWWYGVRAGDRPLNVVFVTDAGQLPTRARLPDWFRERLAGTRLLSGLDVPPGRDLRVCSARAFVRDTPSGRQWALAGDARLTIDPLSGNGVLRAIQDGASAAGFIIRPHTLRLRNEFLQRHQHDFEQVSAKRSLAGV